MRRFSYLLICSVLLSLTIGCSTTPPPTTPTAAEDTPATPTTAAEIPAMPTTAEETPATPVAAVETSTPAPTPAAARIAALPATSITPPGVAGFSVIDINQQEADSEVSDLTIFQGNFYFLLYSTRGIEVWRSDGTAEGTQLVITLLTEPSVTLSTMTLLPTSHHLFILFDDYRHSGGLWASDGTAAGTILLQPLHGNKLYSRDAVVANDLVFFEVGHNSDLWVSNGTIAGTHPLKNVSGYMDKLTPAGDRLYFLVSVGTNTRWIWVSDGSKAGTHQVEVDVPDGLSSSTELLGKIGNQLFFTLNHGTVLQLWRTDTTTGTTEQIQSWGFARMTEHIVLDGKLYLEVDLSDWCSEVCPDGRMQLWVSDGTPGGAQLLGKFYTISKLMTAGQQLFFKVHDDVNSTDLWASDGTLDGTRMVQDITPEESNGGDSFDIDSIIDVNGTLFFSFQHNQSSSGASVSSLWTSDGSEAGTHEIRRFSPSLQYRPVSLINLDGVVFFAAPDIGMSYGLWRSDGTAEGTRRIGDMMMETASSKPQLWGNLNGRMIFTTEDSVSNLSLWASDGTTSGALQLVDPVAGVVPTRVGGHVRFNNLMFFVRSEGQTVRQLWATDGTPEGTRRISEEGIQIIRMPIVSDGRIFFIANQGDQGNALWQSDGTTAGTVIVSDIPEKRDDDYSHVQLFDVGGRPFFLLNDQLWRSDGTAEGTVQLSDQQVDGFLVSNYSRTAVLGQTLFFVQFNQQSRSDDLWHSDGTAEGTSIVWENMLWPDQISLTELTTVGNQLFFAENYSCTLWHSDGTQAGTQMVGKFEREYDWRSGSSYCRLDLIAGSERLFFTTYEKEYGHELWTSDGTAEGTVRLRDIRPGPEDSMIGAMNDADGIMLFFADDGVHGLELWRSDGTPEGTQLATDLAPGPASFKPTQWSIATDDHDLQAGDRIYFSATSLSCGEEILVGPIGDLVGQ